MTTETVESCLDRLRGLAVLCRQRWNAGVEDIYRDILTRHPGDASGWDAVKSLCRKGGSLPSGEELAIALRPARTGTREQTRPAGERLPGCRVRQLLEEGFRRGWAGHHGDERLPDEWSAIFDKWAEKVDAGQDLMPYSPSEDPFADPPQETAQ